MPEPPHLRRILIAWLVLSAIATPIVVLVAAPGIPPGDMTTQGHSQVVDNTVLLGIVTPIAALIAVFFAYVLTTFRRREGEPDEAPAIRGDRRLATTWLVSTTAIVLVLAAYGTTRLFDNGSGGGQGSNPIAKPG